MQVTSFIPAAPPPSGPGASQGRQAEPREQRFDSVYEERAPQQSGRDRSSDGGAIRRMHDGRDSEEPKQTEEQPAEGADRKETAGDDASAKKTDSADESPDVEMARETEAADGADTVVAEAPDEPAVGVAEAPARQPRTGMPEGAESLRAPRAAGEATSQVRTADPEPPKASKAADGAVPEPGTPAKAAQAAAAEQMRAAARPAETEEVQVRRVRTNGPEAAAEGAEPRIDARSRDTEVKAPRTLPTAVAPASFARPAADPMVHLTADPDLSDVGATEVRTTAEHVARAEATVRYDTPRPVMQQVAEAARALRDGPVELTLQPEELGKVRMTLTAGADGNMTMSLQAERSETLELLRRHIGDLARELQDLGFSNLSFSFGQDRAGAGQHQKAGGLDGEGGERPAAAAPLAAPGLAARPNMAPATGGLDLRL